MRGEPRNRLVTAALLDRETITGVSHRLHLRFFLQRRNPCCDRPAFSESANAHAQVVIVGIVVLAGGAGWATSTIYWSPYTTEVMCRCNSQSRLATSIVLRTTGSIAVTATRPWRSRRLPGISPKANPATTSPDLQPCVLQLRDITCELYRNEKSFVRRRGHSSCGRVLIEAFLLRQQRPQLGIQLGHNFENSPLNRLDRNNSRQCCEHQAVRR